MLGRRAAQARAEQLVAASVLVGSGGVLPNAPGVPAVIAARLHAPACSRGHSLEPRHMMARHMAEKRSCNWPPLRELPRSAGSKRDSKGPKCGLQQALDGVQCGRAARAVPCGSQPGIASTAALDRNAESTRLLSAASQDEGKWRYTIPALVSRLSSQRSSKQTGTHNSRWYRIRTCLPR